MRAGVVLGRSPCSLAQTVARWLGKIGSMLKIRIIPCLDVKDGRVVKGVNFVSLRDAGDPVEQALVYDAAGADELCFLDITASHEKRPILLDVVRRTAEACFMPLTVGGGVRTSEDIRGLLLAGADKVSINTEAVKRPDFIREAAEKFGSQCIVAAIDEIFEDPQYAARENIVRIQDPRVGEIAVPNVVPRLTGTPGSVDTLGPALGAHNNDVYSALLGLSDTEIEELGTAGVI